MTSKELAKERIQILFEQAEKAKNQELANKYIQTARRIAMKINLTLPRTYKIKFCKHCYNYFRLKNYRVRTRDKKIVYYCLNCKKYTKFSLLSKR